VSSSFDPLLLFLPQSGKEKRSRFAAANFGKERKSHYDQAGRGGNASVREHSVEGKRDGHFKLRLFRT